MGTQAYPPAFSRLKPARLQRGGWLFFFLWLWPRSWLSSGSGFSGGWRAVEEGFDGKGMPFASHSKARISTPSRKKILLSE